MHQLPQQDNRSALSQDSERVIGLQPVVECHQSHEHLPAFYARLEFADNPYEQLTGHGEPIIVILLIPELALLVD